MRYAPALAALAASAALVCLTVQLRAQTTPTAAYMTVDVVLENEGRRGQPLAATDFEIVDSGEVRTIDAARLETGGTRAIAIFLDEYHVEAGAAERARLALAQFVQSDVRDNDTLIVVKPLDPLHAITPSRDRTAVLQAIATFEGRKGNYEPRSEFERNFLSRNPATADVSRAQVVTSALQALATKLGESPSARKALILVSEGFRSPTARAVVYAANRAGVAVHALDPNQEPGENESTLEMIATQTSGAASLNQPSLAPLLAQAIADLDRHYVITYQAAGHADGKFHPVEVRVKRPGVRVRARTGYWAPVQLTPAASRLRTIPTLGARPSRSSPYIRPWIGMSRGASGLTSVTVTWEAGAAPPRNRQLTWVNVKATNTDGKVLIDNRIDGGRNRVRFDAAPGYVALEMTLHTEAADPLDTDYRSLVVPDLRVMKPTIATPQVFRARTARGFAELNAETDPVPTSARSFSRTERLLLRVPVYGPDGSEPAVSATLLNRSGDRMRDLPVLSADAGAGIFQFDLLLSSLAPGEYRVQLTATFSGVQPVEVRELLNLTVTN